VVADLFLFLEPRIGAKPKHVVVGKSRTAERPARIILLGRGIKPEFIGAFNFHSQILLLCVNTEIPTTASLSPSTSPA